jgi:serine/threonine protein kinase
LKAAQIWNAMKHIASGVTFIHTRNEVHRDLNLRNGTSPSELLTNSRFFGPARTLHGSWLILGSPRQARQKKFNLVISLEEQRGIA